MKTIHEIVAPVDLSEHSETIVDYAAFMAEKLSAGLTIIHVVERLQVMGEMLIDTTTIDEFNSKRHSHCKQLMEELLANHPGCTGVVITGEIVDEIVKFSRDKPADIIIIGTHGSKGLEKLLLGSVAERVVKNAHCPTLVINPYRHKNF